MKRRSTLLVMSRLRLATFACGLHLVLAYPYPLVAAAQQPAVAAPQQRAAPVAPADANAQTPGRGRGRGPQPVDPRVQIRTHHFAETNEDIPYALFVSSKVKKDKKAPMIVTLHGLGGTIRR